MNYFIESLTYVVSDQYFLMAMGMTISIGMFIGALLYDGILSDLRKATVSIAMYAMLLVMTNYSRIAPIIFAGDVHDVKQPFAGIVTILTVTIAYLLGLWIGVLTTSKAHKGKHDGRRNGDSLFVKID